jgi:hypothetical protein
MQGLFRTVILGEKALLSRNQSLKILDALTMGEPQHNIGKALILVVGALIVIPGSFAYYILANALREQNLCHVGPISLKPNSLDSIQKFQERRASVLNLYGTYTTFDDASYYFVKTPYEISPQVLPDYGYWSISTLSLTLLSPFLRRQRQEDWKSLEDTYDIETAPAIQWDQSHEIDFTPRREHSSQSNRWCLQNHQDPKKYHRKGDVVQDPQAKYKAAVFGSKAVGITEVSKFPELFRICARPQASILSSGDQAPYFVELPLQPPMAGIWRRYETDSILTKPDDDDGDVEGRQYARYRRSKRPSNPYQLQVQCHVRDLDLHHLAHGSLQPDSMPHLGWEHAESIVMPQWNVFYLPGTFAILLVLILVQLRRRSRPSRRRQREPQQDHDWNLVRAVQQLWIHETWQQWALTSVWVYFIGANLEPLVGTMPYLGITVVFLQLVAIVSSDACFLWVCFGQSVLLAQIEPSLSIGPLEISAISLGDSSNALKLNIVSVLIALIPFLQPSAEIPWRSAASCLLVGWSLAKPLTLELLGAPQWTIPTLFLGHLWWKLTKLPDQDLKKTDDEMTAFCEEDGDDQDYDEETVFSDESDSLSVKQRILQFTKMIGTYVLFGSWLALTIGCIFTMDWTLVVGNMMTLWLCIGSNQFPRHPLWSLYHMVASSVLIILNAMTLTGWYLCHVAISTRALNALPPVYVYASMILQTAAHLVALIHTVHTKHWETPHVPGHYFWSNVRIVGEEIRLWYYVFF